MKKVFTILLYSVSCFVSFAQELSLLSVPNHDYESAAYWLEKEPSYIALQSINGRDTIRTPFMYSWARIYQESIDGEASQYAICRIINGTIYEYEDSIAFYCLDSDLKVRFKYPDNLFDVYPFRGGLSIVKKDHLPLPLYKYGAVNRDGVLIFPIQYDVLVVIDDKVVTFRDDNCVITTHDCDGHILWEQHFYITESKECLNSLVFDEDRRSAIDRDYKDFKDSRQEIALIKALICCIYLDYPSAEAFLHQSMKGCDSAVRRAARNNLKFVRSKI